MFRRDILMQDMGERPRMDNFNSVIKPGGKQRVVFADEFAVASRKRRLADVHIVESFKKYNRDMSRHPATEACCTVF